MYCYQCEQTAKGTGCTVAGVCGKDGRTAVLQDVLLNVTTGLSMYATRLRKQGVINHNFDIFVMEALFTTVTNVNFDPATIVKLINKGIKLRDEAKLLYKGPELYDLLSKIIPLLRKSLWLMEKKSQLNLAEKKLTLPMIRPAYRNL